MLSALFRKGNFISTKSSSNSSRSLPEKTHLHGNAYGVSKVLGQGGFAITYLGGDLNLHRYVAIKEFFPADCVRQGNIVQPSNALSPADFEIAKQKFLQEARALARFQHPNIVQVLSIFEENNAAYMVLEFLKGKTLMKMLEERKTIPEQEAIEYTKQICEALIEVHNASLLHLDIKPENVIVCDDGRVVLIDFGLNKKMEKSASHATRALSHTTQLGSEIYAPPEQHLGDMPMDAATDIYALGATLYHLLTGTAPVPAPERAMGSKLIPPGQINPDISPVVSAVIMRAMRLQSDQRPQSAQAFMNSLAINTNVAIPQVATTSTTGTKVLLTPPTPTGTTVLSPQTVTQTYNQQPPVNLADNSGMGAYSVLPDELKGFNWGGFFLNWIWSINQKTWIGLICLVPFAGYIMCFLLGFKGNEWAWQNRKWESIEQFRSVQNSWKHWAFWVAGISFVVGIYLVTFTKTYNFAHYFPPAENAQTQLNTKPVPLTPEEKKYLTDLRNIMNTAFSTTNTDFTDANARANKSGDFEQAKVALYYLKAPPRMVRAGFPSVTSLLTNAMNKIQIAFTRMNDVDNYLADAEGNARAGNEEMYQQDKSSAEQGVTDVEQQLKEVDNMLNTSVTNYNQAYANLNAPPSTTTP